MRGTIGLFFVLLAVVMAILTFGIPLASYYHNSYPVDQAAAFVDLAAADNNLTEVLNDLNTTLSMLAPFHGNPVLWFPTAHTNFDDIKEQIHATILSGEIVVHQSPDNYSYQQALKNIQSDLTTTVEGELSDTSGAAWWWGGGWAILLTVPLTIVFLILARMAW